MQRGSSNKPEEIFITNLKLLGFDPLVHCKDTIIIDKDTFTTRPNCIKAFEVITYFLFNTLDKTKTRRSFQDIWPITCIKDSLSYRNRVFAWLSEIRPGTLLERVPLRKSYFSDCRGDNINKIIMALSTIVLENSGKNNNIVHTSNPNSSKSELIKDSTNHLGRLKETCLKTIESKKRWSDDRADLVSRIESKKQKILPRRYSCSFSANNTISQLNQQYNNVKAYNERKEQEERERLDNERLEQERLEQERLELERLELERLELERLEQERMEQEILKRERLEKERLEKERREQERREQERREHEHERREQERREQERCEQERCEHERREHERREHERREHERREHERREHERREHERREQERLEEERLEEERLEEERLEEERLEQVWLEREPFERERREQEQLGRERREQEQREQERYEQERLEQERLQIEHIENEWLEQRRLERERLIKEQLELERLDRERLERERLERERREQERLERERLEQERLEREQLEQERAKKQRIQKERIQKERIEKERIEKERINQERIEQELAEKERSEEQQKLITRLEKERSLKQEKFLRDRSEQERRYKEICDKESRRKVQKLDAISPKNKDDENKTVEKVPVRQRERSSFGHVFSELETNRPETNKSSKKPEQLSRKRTSEVLNSPESYTRFQIYPSSPYAPSKKPTNATEIYLQVSHILNSSAEPNPNYIIPNLPPQIILVSPSQSMSSVRSQSVSSIRSRRASTPPPKVVSPSPSPADIVSLSPARSPSPLPPKSNTIDISSNVNDTEESIVQSSPKSTIFTNMNFPSKPISSSRTPNTSYTPNPEESKHSFQSPYTFESAPPYQGSTTRKVYGSPMRTPEQLIPNFDNYMSPQRPLSIDRKAFSPFPTSGTPSRPMKSPQIIYSPQRSNIRGLDDDDYDFDMESVIDIQEEEPPEWTPMRMKTPKRF